MKLEGAFLRGRLGRRIFISFGLAVTIPTVIVFWLTYRHGADLAARNDAATLRVENKHFALSVFERLKTASTTLQAVSESQPDRLPRTSSMFSEIFLEELRNLKITTDPLEKRAVTLVTITRGMERPRVALLARAGPAAESKVLVAVIDPSYLWGAPDTAISDGQICVLSQSISLSCFGEAPAASPNRVLTDEWELFLEPEFGVPSWRFKATQQKRTSFKTYAGLLGPVALGMLLLALLLSSIEIRRILGPLEALVARIKHVGGGKATDFVYLDDEFATLEKAFGEMESRISAQFSTLSTLQEIDRLILSKAPLIEVIELVLASVGNHVPGRPMAVSISGSGGHQLARHFLATPPPCASIAPQLGADPIADEGQSLFAPTGHWQRSTSIGPGFSEMDLVEVDHLTVGPEGGPFIRIAVGRRPVHEADKVIPPESVAELARRIGVAVAAEAHESRLIHQARHDVLTDLPNRLAVLEALPRFMRQADQAQLGFATLFIDIDRFKAINDGLGHSLANTVLIEISRRLRASASPGALVARLGGDEFLVVIPGAGSQDSALSADRALRAGMNDPIVVGNESLSIDFSSGIAIYPDDGTDAEMLMHNADLAMYRAKRAGGGAAVSFNVEMNQSAIRRVHMENDLREALRSGQLHLHYQPRIDSRYGSIVGAEALVRWEHPTLGRILPTEFIGLAEECGLIVELGRFVIQEACRQLSSWKAAGLNLPLLAINVSPHQLRGGELFNTISKAVQQYGLTWSELEIEITESVLVKDSSYAGDQLQRLRDAGATIAIDDFGTGYSSLAYLTTLPTDTIKIDKAFASFLHDQESQAVVLSIIALGKGLGKSIVAEGIESMADVQLLNSWGCHIIQGYVYFPPLTPDELAAQLFSA